VNHAYRLRPRHNTEEAAEGIDRALQHAVDEIDGDDAAVLSACCAMASHSSANRCRSGSLLLDLSADLRKGTSAALEPPGVLMKSGAESAW
jgi:hypothetical protein